MQVPCSAAGAASRDAVIQAFEEGHELCAVHCQRSRMEVAGYAFQLVKVGQP